MIDYENQRIDYNKLNIALELAKKCNVSLDMNVNVHPDSFCILKKGFSCYVQRKAALETELIGIYSNIDDLITKLQELTQPKPKYKIGQEVWFYRGDNSDVKVADIKIMDIDKFADGFFYSDEHGWFREDHLYPSKQALIQAQIEYWTCLKNEDLSTHSDDV